MKPLEHSMFITLSFNRAILCVLLKDMITTSHRLCFALVLVATSLLGETDWGTIKGTVTDATGRVLSGVSVTVHIPETGFRRLVVTNRDGSYVIPSVPIGALDLTFELAGFQTLAYNDTPLVTGQIWTQDAQLALASQSETVTVHAEAVKLNRENAELSDVIGSRQVSEIPLDGRNWQGLMMMAPGAINTGSGDARGIRFLGRGADDNIFRLDGVDATGIRNQAPRDDIRLAIPLDSVAEFRVRSGQYNAETGGSMGAQVEIVSRTGSNDFHGSVFEYFRNDKLNARSPFDPAKRPPFRLNQFGAALGGYLVKNKTFFYMNYEGLAQRLAQSETGFVPSESYRTRVSATNPDVARLVNAYPRPTGTTSDPDIGLWTGQGSDNNDQHSGMARIDHRFTDRDLFFGRFNRTNMDARSPLLRDSSGQLGQNSNVYESITSSALSYQKVFNPSLVNDARAGYNRVPYFYTWDSPTIPAVTVAGFTTLPGARVNNITSTSNTYVDTLTWVHGRHTLKTGFEVRRVKMVPEVPVDASTMSFQNPDALAAGRLSNATILTPSPVRVLLKNQYFIFIQDEFKISPTFSATLGLRWEDFGVLHEEHDRGKPFDLETCGGYCPSGSPYTFGDNNNFAPRVGFAWSPRSLGGRTVIRSGFGIYYGEGQLGNQFAPNNNEATRAQFNGALPQGVTMSDLLANVVPEGVPVTSSPLNLERRRKDMYTSQWSMSVQQELFRGYIAEAGYVGTKGSQLFIRSYVNGIDPATGARPYPQFGLIGFRGNGNDSSFNGLLLSLRRQTAHGLTLAANYQWSHAIDNDSAGGDDADYPQNVNCRSCEKASSNFDVRHNFVTSVVYEMPFGPGRRYLRSGLASKLTGGWELSGIGILRTGRPFSVAVSRSAASVLDGNVSSPQRPNIVPGVSLVPADQTAANWVNLAAFTVPQAGTWGNAGRNDIVGPGCANLDLSLTRRTRVTERMTVDFRAEMFNVFNNPKYANPQANISAPATFGLITQLTNTSPTGVGTARQVEFALRLSF